MGVTLNSKPSAGKAPVAKKVALPVRTYTSVEGKGVEKHTDEAIKVLQVPSPHSTVEVKLGFTKNLGNFESLRFDVGISVPCARGKEDKAYAFAYGWADEKLESIMTELEEE